MSKRSPPLQIYKCNYSALTPGADGELQLVKDRIAIAFSYSGVNYFLYPNAKNNLAASAAPTANDDSGDGYGVGSIWINTTADTVYICVDATLTAAIWTQLGSGYTDEQAQDAVGTILVDDTTIDFTYNDGTPSITAVVKGLQETSGPTKLAMGAVNDGEFLFRDGATVKGETIDYDKGLAFLTRGRLTLTTNTPITTSDVAAAGTLYFTQFNGYRIGLYDPTPNKWRLRTFTEASLSLTGITNGSYYDVFAYWTGAAVAIELSAAWVDSTTRTDALVTQEGVWVKSADHSRKWIGSIKASADNQTEDSVANRYVYNHWHQIARDIGNKNFLLHAADEKITATGTANALPRAGSGGTLDISWIPLGTTASTVCIGNDSRLSDARTPTAHAASHVSGGGDSVKLDDLGSPDDNTDLNASAAAHGLLRKLSGTATQYLGGDGNWTVPAGTLDIVGLTAADLALDDALPFYDLSATANQKATVERMLGFVLRAPQGRLTLTSGTPVTTSDVTGAMAIYYSPYLGNRITLYDGTRWIAKVLPEIALAIAGANNTNFDLFVFTSAAVPNSTDTALDTVTFSPATNWKTGAWARVSETGGGLTAGTDYWLLGVGATFQFHPTLADALANTNRVNLTASITATVTAVTLNELAWTNDITRATGLTRTEGVLHKTGDQTQLYLGTHRTTSATPSTEDSTAKRFVWNYYHRVSKVLQVLEDANSWSYTTGSWRQMNADTTNQVALVQGWPEETVRIEASAIAAGAAIVYASIGEDSTTTPEANATPVQIGDYMGTGIAVLMKVPVVGYHYYAALEYGAASATFYGDAGISDRMLNGIRGVWWC